MEVFLIRHGATKGNLEHRYVGRTDESILDTEWKKLRKTGEKLGRMDHVFTSPYLRCLQSAEALFAMTEKVEVVKDFREMDFGAFEYKNFQELDGNPDYQKFIDSGGRIAFPGGEEPEQFKARCRKAFENSIEKAEKEQWEKVAFVVHGGTIMAILEAYGLPKKDYFDYQVRNGEGFFGRVTQGRYISICFSFYDR